MNWVDLAIAGLIAFHTIRAFSNGLIREAVTLAALVLGVVLAGMFYADLAADIDFLIDDPTARHLAAFLAIFGGIVVAGWIGGIVLRQAAQLFMLGPFDRLGGAAFGFVRGVVLVQVLLIALAVFPAVEWLSGDVEESRIAAVFLDRLPGVERLLLPGEFDSPLESLREWRDRGDEALGRIDSRS